MTDIHFLKFYTEYFRRCVLFAKSYVYDDMVAENIASESIVILWDKLNQGIDVQYPLPFLMGVVRNKVLHYLRSKESDFKLCECLQQKNEEEIIFRINSLEACSPHELYNKDIMQILQYSLDTMSDQTRKIFIMSRFKNMSYKDIAIVLGISEKTVEYHISKSLKILRDELKDYLPLYLFFI